MTYGKLLGKILQQKGWTWTRLAAETGIPRPTLAMYGTDRSTPSLSRAFLICTALEVPMETFAKCKFCVTHKDAT